MTANTFRKAYSVACVLLLLEFLIQFYVIAASMFSTLAKQLPTASQVELSQVDQTVEPFAAAHAVIGIFIIPPTSLVLLGLAFGARHPRRTIGLTALVFLLMVVQFGLAAIGFVGVAAVAGLHGINALILFGLGAWLTWKHWAFGHHEAGAQTSSC